MTRLENLNSEMSEKNKPEETNLENASPIIPVVREVISKKIPLPPGMVAVILTEIGKGVKNNDEPDVIVQAFNQLTETDRSLYAECVEEMGLGWRAAAQAASKAEQAGCDSSKLKEYALTLQNAAYPTLNSLKEGTT